jgi:hypothetical protein
MLVIAVLAMAVTNCCFAAENNYDVVVVGAGTGGFAASLQAARLGAKVALLEETDWIGGQMTAAAVSTMDEGERLKGPQGIYDEFRDKIGNYYARRGKSVGTCYYHNTSHCYEPSVAQKILYEMIDETNRGPRGKVLDVFLRQRVVKVLWAGNKVTGAVTQDGTEFHSKVLIDATEFGDVSPLTPAAYRSGNNLSSAAQHPACIQSITYVGIIKKYPAGVPKNLSMREPPPGYDDAFVRAAKLRMQTDGNAASMTLPVSFTAFKIYRGLPDSSNPEDYAASDGADITRTGLDWFNDYAVTTDILDRQKRKEIVCAAKLKTLDYLYFLQHELHESLWSVADDEGFDTAYNREENSCPNILDEFKAIERNMPLIPYARESRRVVGLYTLTSVDMRREGYPPSAVKQFSSAIGLGDYGNDMHGCDRDADMESEFEHAGDRTGDRGLSTGAFQVPIEALIPEVVDGLLVAEKNLSQSRLASGATRLQPITMVIGQASGALAALAATRGLQPRQVPVEEVQAALLGANSSLSPQAFADTPMGTELWRAAQFTAVHGWLTPRDTERFGYGDILSRGEMAEALAMAFSLESSFHEWRENAAQQQRYKDVPLYSRFAGAVEKLVAARVIGDCAGQAGFFCPANPATEAEMVRGIRVLAGPGAVPTAAEAVLAKHDRLIPLSKGVAAEILYSYGANRPSETAKEKQ